MSDEHSRRSPACSIMPTARNPLWHCRQAARHAHLIKPASLRPRPREKGVATGCLHWLQPWLRCQTLAASPSWPKGRVRDAFGRAPVPALRALPGPTASVLLSLGSEAARPHLLVEAWPKAAGVQRLWEGPAKPGHKGLLQTCAHPRIGLDAPVVDSRRTHRRAPTQVRPPYAQPEDSRPAPTGSAPWSREVGRGCRCRCIGPAAGGTGSVARQPPTVDEAAQCSFPR